MSYRYICPPPISSPPIKHLTFTTSSSSSLQYQQETTFLLFKRIIQCFAKMCTGTFFIRITHTHTHTTLDRYTHRIFVCAFTFHNARIPPLIRDKSVVVVALWNGPCKVPARFAKCFFCLMLLQDMAATNAQNRAAAAV